MISSEDEVMEEEVPAEAEVAVNEGDGDDDEHEPVIDDADASIDEEVETINDDEQEAAPAVEDDEHEGADGDAEQDVAEEESAVNDSIEHEDEHEDAEAEANKKSEVTPKRPRKKGAVASGSSRKGRAPAVKGLTIPFRAVKRTMKLDKDIATVQNEAAILTTLATEMFLKSLAKESHRTAKNHGRNTIRYEDVAEARTKKPALDFLETLLP